MNRNKLLFGFALIVWFGVTAGRLVDARQAECATATGATPPAQQTPAQTPPAQAPPTTLPPGYAGTDTCVVCHEPEEKSITHSRHGQVKDPRSPAATLGCESCHGPGQAHVDDDAKGKIKKFKELKPGEVSDTCLTCHNRGTHAGWEASAHAARNLSCTTCHSVHSPNRIRASWSSRPRRMVCATCHRVQVVKTERAVAHMPVREGKMSCSSCHNPHGSISNVKTLKVGSSINETLHELSRGDARADVVGTHAGARELHDLSRPARFIERSHAERAHADALSALSRGDEAPGDGVRQRRDHDQQEQSHVRAVVRELPLERPWFESPFGPVLHAVRAKRMRLSVSACVWSAGRGRVGPGAAGPRRRADLAAAGPTPIAKHAGAAAIADQASAGRIQAAQPAATPEPAAEDTRSLFAPTWNMFQLSGRVSSISGDPARWQRYQDLRRRAAVHAGTRAARNARLERQLQRRQRRLARPALHRQLRTDRLPQNQRTL